MVTVIFSSELQRVTGEEKTTVNGSTYREIVAELVDRYNLEEHLLMDMAIAIDGLIIHDPLLEKVEAGSEIHFLHRISGG